MKIRRLFIYVVFLTVLLSFYITYLSGFYTKYTPTLSKTVVHMGTILIGYNSTFNLYTSLKSILLTRTTSLHFHIVTDAISKNSLKIMFRKWKISNVTVEYYDISGLPLEQYTKLTFFEIIDASKTHKIVVFDADTIFNCDVLKLWNLDKNFRKEQVIGLLISGLNNSFRNHVMLYRIDHFTGPQKETLHRILSDTKSVQNNEEAVTSFIKIYHNIVAYVFLNSGNIGKVNDDIRNNNTKVLRYDGSLLRDSRSQKNFANSSANHTECSDFEEAVAYNWRILPYVKSFKPNPSANVTFVSQLSYERIYMLKEISVRWKGPMSLTLYVTDEELIKSLEFIAKTELLANRTNIAYHVIFKENLHYPVNLGRNVAWRHATTPFVFLCDIDFVPMQDMDVILQKYVTEQTNMTGKALIVPAFQTVKYSNFVFPKDKKGALKLFNSGQLVPFASTRYKPGQGSTNYMRWKKASRPYRITWRSGYEPYIVVATDTVKFDERFVGYGSNKVFHSIRLYLLRYEFYVLPNTFIIHKYHPPSEERIAFRKPHVRERYRRCLYRVVVRDAVRDLQKLCNKCNVNKLFIF